MSHTWVWLKPTASGSMQNARQLKMWPAIFYMFMNTGSGNKTILFVKFTFETLSMYQQQDYTTYKIPHFIKRVYMWCVSYAESIPNKTVTVTKIYHSRQSRSGLSRGLKSLFYYKSSLFMLLQGAITQPRQLHDSWTSETQSIWSINLIKKKDCINITMTWKLSC